MQIRAECPSRRLELTTKGGKERVRRQFFPFELIMAGSAARRAGEPFVQQFLDKHSRAGAAFVGVPLPAVPYSFASPRQHGPTFPGRAPPLLASPSPLRLIPSWRHANTVRLFPGERRLCWRLPPREALFLRRATPTLADFSRAGAAFVGVPLPAAPYSFVALRQHGPTFPGRAPPLLASPSPRSLISSSRHANTVRLFPGGRRLCWRPPPRCALFLRLATPTRPGNFLTRPGNFLTNWRIGVLENKKSRIVPTTIPQVFVKRSLFRKHLRSASYS